MGSSTNSILKKIEVPEQRRVNQIELLNQNYNRINRINNHIKCINLKENSINRYVFITALFSMLFLIAYKMESNKNKTDFKYTILSVLGFASCLFINHMYYRTNKRKIDQNRIVTLRN